MSVNSVQGPNPYEIDIGDGKRVEVHDTQTESRLTRLLREMFGWFAVKLTIDNKDVWLKKGSLKKVLADSGSGSSQDAKTHGLALKMLGTLSNLPKLKEIGVSAKDLRKVGYTLTQLQDANFTASELRDAGFGAKELWGAGFGVNLKFAFTALELKNAGFSISELGKAKFSPWVLLRSGYELTDLKEGFTAEELREEEFSVEKLKEAGFTAKELKKADFTAKELMRVGFSIKELREVKFGARELQKAVYELARLHLDKQDQYPVDRHMEASYLYSLMVLINGGFTLEELRDAGFGDIWLKEAAAKLEEVSSGVSPGPPSYHTY